MIKTLINYFHYRKLGLRISKSLELAKHPMLFIDMLVICCVIGALIWLAYNVLQAEYDYRYINMRFKEVTLAHRIENQVKVMDRYEKIIISCLTGDSVRLEGIDRPCKVGEYRDGHEKF